MMLSRDYPRWLPVHNRSNGFPYSLNTIVCIAPVSFKLKNPPLKLSQMLLGVI